MLNDFKSVISLWLFFILVPESNDLYTFILIHTNTLTCIVMGNSINVDIDSLCRFRSFFKGAKDLIFTKLYSTALLAKLNLNEAVQNNLFKQNFLFYL